MEGKFMKNIILIILIIGIMLFLAQSRKVAKNVEIDTKSILIDVRTNAEYSSGHLKNAINIPHDQIQTKIMEIVKDKNAKIVLYCRSGNRSGIAESVLKKMGYSNVVNAGAYDTLKNNYN